MSNSLRIFHQLQADLNQIILGQERLIERLLIVLLADGHLLVEGAPGLAKTRAIKALGEKIEGEFQRIQFTPDLLPADVTGTDIYRPQEGSFHFQSGPVFHNLVLADEINRAPAKVQSALLEAMGERQVTVGGQTYPLPEAQLDRFLLHVFIDYPSIENELKIMRIVRKEALSGIQISSDKSPKSTVDSGTKSAGRKISTVHVFEARNEVLNIYMAPEIERYLVEIIAATRIPEKYSDELARLITWGASPRGALSLDRCARARAWLHERDYVTPEDLQNLSGDVLRHRIIESYEAESDGITTDDVIAKILAQVAVP